MSKINAFEYEPFFFLVPHLLAAAISLPCVFVGDKVAFCAHAGTHSMHACTGMYCTLLFNSTVIKGASLRGRHTPPGTLAHEGTIL